MQFVSNLFYSSVMGALPGYLVGSIAVKELNGFEKFKKMQPERIYLYKVLAVALSILGFFVGGVVARSMLPPKAEDAFLQLAARGVIQVGVGFTGIALQALGWVQVGISEYMRQARNGEL